MQEVTFKIAGTSDQQSNILLAGRLKKLPGVEQVIVDLARLPKSGMIPNK